ncbi:hypothetical protein HHL17_03795 [Chitinophaga sp. G-6-1-13]|uniref:SMP-30/Gluconolactonase/LRE-like region domain-containing protein n=1 Tax=Chitinophaga fulva TaxID=2728842 RepID=A0A848GCW1_9BACT|nr:hypothetical protein [Chitinophaga fulva]NML36314.1 hypothetical protein [Chitinophaga fulva]
MKKSLPLLLAGILATTVSFAQSTGLRTVTGLLSPESVVAWKGGYFVSQMGYVPDLAAKDGNGAIAFVKGHKIKSPRYFNDTLHAPKGLTIIDHTLYVTDIDHLKGYDIKSRKKVFDLNLEGKAGMLNDITPANDSLLVMTDSFKGDVWLVNSHTVTIKQLGNIPAANGVLYNKSTDELYVCSMGPGMNGKGLLWHRKLNVNGEVFEPVKNSPTGLFDGIVQLDSNHLCVSDWTAVIELKHGPKHGTLHVYNLSAGTDFPILVTHSPADIALDKWHQLLIPVMLDNTLQIWSPEETESIYVPVITGGKLGTASVPVDRSH